MKISFSSRVYVHRVQMKILFFVFATLLFTQVSSAQTAYDILSAKKSPQILEIQSIKNITSPGLWPEEGTTGKILVDNKLKIIYLSIVITKDTLRAPLIQKRFHIDDVMPDETCKFVTYTGTSQLNGISEKVTVIDNSKNVCDPEAEVTQIRLEVMKDSRSSIVDMIATQTNRLSFGELNH